jgi:hypothetical protein
LIADTNGSGRGIGLAGAYISMNPRLAAMVTAWVRSETPSLVKMAFM